MHGIPFVIAQTKKVCSISTKLMYIINQNVLVTCPALTLPNGEVVYTPSTQVNGRYPVGTVASFLCDYGYSRSGCVQTTCLSSGSCNLHAPTCNRSKQNNIYSYIALLTTSSSELLYYLQWNKITT